MYEESSCFDPNPTVESIVDNNGGFCYSVMTTERDFPVSHQFQPPLLVAGSTTNSFNDDDFKLPTMEECSVFPFPNSETQNQNISNNNNQMIHESNWAVSGDNSGFFMNTSNPNITTTTTTQIPDLLSLLQLPRCSIPLPSSNLSDIMAGSCFSYDPLFHLNLLPQPPLIPSNDYSEFLLGIDTNTTQRDQSNVVNENNNAQFHNGIIEFSKEIRRKGRGKRKIKPFTTERERRCHLNERYEALKLLIPNPSKGDRASILQDGIDYINELRRRVSELKYLVERKKCGGRQKNNNEVLNNNNNNSDDQKHDEEDDDENMEKKPESDVIDQCSSNNSLRCSWLQRKSKVTEVDVRIIDDEVTIKVVQRKKINCLLFVSKVIDQLQLDLHHVAGGQVGENYSFLLNTKINEGSTIYASAIANRVIEVVDQNYMVAQPINNVY